MSALPVPRRLIAAVILTVPGLAAADPIVAERSAAPLPGCGHSMC